MLSLFPELLDWSFFVPFFFRMFIGLYVLTASYHLLKKQNQDDLPWRIFGILLLIDALSLLFGVYIQVAGAVTFVISLMAISTKKQQILEVNESRTFYLLFALVALSFVFLGAGPYAFDLPL